MLTSLDCLFTDFKAVAVNDFSKTDLRMAVTMIVLSDALASVCVPHQVIRVETDLATSTSVVRIFIEACDNANLGDREVVKNGHIPDAVGWKVHRASNPAFLRCKR